MMQVLIDGEVWYGTPGEDALTYDPIVAPLPVGRDDLIDPVAGRGVAVWQKGDHYHTAPVCVETTLVRGRITAWGGKRARKTGKPEWWVDDREAAAQRMVTGPF
jgi:hypothetical protein